MAKQYYHFTARLEYGVDDEAIKDIEEKRVGKWTMREIIVDAVNARIGTPPVLFRTTQSVKHTVQALDSVLTQRLDAMQQAILNVLQQAPRNVVLTPPEPTSNNYQQARNNLIESMKNRKGGAK